VATVAKTLAPPPCHTLTVPERSAQKRRPPGAKARATGKLAAIFPPGSAPPTPHGTGGGGGGGGGGNAAGLGGGGGGGVGDGDSEGDGDGEGVAQVVAAQELGLGRTATRAGTLRRATTTAPTSTTRGIAIAATWAGRGIRLRKPRITASGYRGYSWAACFMAMSISSSLAWSPANSLRWKKTGRPPAATTRTPPCWFGSPLVDV
jgi:hypothetical protein